MKSDFGVVGEMAQSARRPTGSTESGTDDAGQGFVASEGTNLFGHDFHCPMSGNRTPELAAGRFLEFFHEVADLAWADVLMNLPVRIETEDMEKLQDAWQRGRARLQFILSNKTFNWSVMPWRST